jgi:putative methanogenesis marker protein 8
MSADVVRDIHVLRYFSSFVSVSHGRVIHVTEPGLSFCPLAGHLYKGLKNTRGADQAVIKREIQSAIESKIRDYGLFTEQRSFSVGDVAIPFGASEMLMLALSKKSVDAAVIVCDGAGTVIANHGPLVQGIGARMNSLVLTTPIKGVMDRLQDFGCHVVFDNAFIDQVKGVKKAIDLGYKRIAVTVSGHDADKLEGIRALETPGRVTITILVVCTTGIAGSKVEFIQQYADLVWSCASEDVRQKVGASARLQISKTIPVFVMTSKGTEFIAAYAEDARVLLGLGEQKQYLISNEPGGQELKMGASRCFLREKELPVLSDKSFSLAGA